MTKPDFVTPPTSHRMAVRRRLGDLFGEPLFQFLFIGMVLFIVHALVAPADEEGKQIVVSQARVDDMAREYRAQLGGAPTPEQLSHLVDTYVHDEILYREGMAMGLGRDDPVVRRRVVQKYQIILEEAVGQTAPTDADLAAYLKARPADFARPARVTFDQVFFETMGSPEDFERRFERARRAATSGVDPMSLGEESMLPRRVEAVSIDVVAQDFGPAFAQSLAGAPVGRWVGPVASAYGAHLVRVAVREPPSTPPLAEVRSLVAREWEADRRRRTEAASYQEVRAAYDVEIEARLKPQLAAR